MSETTPGGRPASHLRISAPWASALSPRAMVTLIFMTYGVAAGLYSGSIPAVMAATGAGKELFGIALMLNTLVYVVTMWWGGRHVEALTPRRALMLSLPLHALSLGAVLLATSPAMLIGALMFFAVGAGITDLAMNARGAALERASGRPMMARFHGLTSVVTGIFAIVASVIAARAGMWPSVALIALVFACAWFVARGSRDDTPKAVTTTAGRSGFRPSWPASLLGLILGLAMAGETAAMMWSAAALTDMAPGLAIISGAGISFFALCHAAGRFAADGLRRRISDTVLIGGSLALAAAGFALIALEPGFGGALAGFALTGLGTAAVVPIGFALATQLDPQARAAGLGYVSLVAGLPRVIFPFAFGSLAEAVSNEAAFAVTGLALALAPPLVFAFARAGIRKARCRSPETSRGDAT